MAETFKSTGKPLKQVQTVPYSLRFEKCARGFVVYGLSWETYAFDRIEDLAQWLIDQYGEPKPEVQSTGGWGRAFRGSDETGELLKGENGQAKSGGGWGPNRYRVFNLPNVLYRLPVDHWFYQHPLSVEAKP